MSGQHHVSLTAEYDEHHSGMVIIRVGSVEIDRVEPTTTSRAYHGDERERFEFEARRVAEETFADWFRRRILNEWGS